MLRDDVDYTCEGVLKNCTGNWGISRNHWEIGGNWGKIGWKLVNCFPNGETEFPDRKIYFPGLFHNNLCETVVRNEKEFHFYHQIQLHSTVSPDKNRHLKYLSQFYGIQFLDR